MSFGDIVWLQLKHKTKYTNCTCTCIYYDVDHVLLNLFHCEEKISGAFLCMCVILLLYITNILCLALSITLWLLHGWGCLNTECVCLPTRTNFPREMQTFPGCSYPDSIPEGSFLKHRDVLEYPRSYAEKFQLRSRIKVKNRGYCC